MFKVIVWATDGSRLADHALPLAKGLAESSGAKLVVVHVDELSTGRAGAYHLHADEDELRRKVEECVERLKADGLDAQLEVAKTGTGGAAHIIAEVARDAGADLIVAGTRGHGPVVGLLLGSVTHRLLHIAPCPVLVVPPEDR
jgi:nucleotide-binding universal stress UspA family protein